MIEVTEEMQAVADRLCPDVPHGYMREALEAVLAIVKRDYVSRWGHITERVPREFMDTPSMDGFKGMVVEHAEYMGAEVVDIDHPEVLPDEGGPFTFIDYVTLRWKIRRTA